MSPGWPCPKCGASCRTVDTLQIHTSRCRAMSLSEASQAYTKGMLEYGFSLRHEGKEFNQKESHEAGIAAIHKFHIAKLRGRK